MAEIAVALVLSIGAGLLIQSFGRLLDRELGFDPQGRLAVQVFAYDEKDQPNLPFVERSIEAIGALPGMQAVGVTTVLPLADDRSISAMAGTTPFTIDGRATVGGEPVAWRAAIDGAYPSAMGIAVKAGRAFTTHDHSRSPRGDGQRGFRPAPLSGPASLGSAHQPSRRQAVARDRGCCRARSAAIGGGPFHQRLNQALLSMNSGSDER